MRTRYFLMFFCVCMISLSVNSQTLMPDSYDGIPQSSKQRLFMDNFDNNNYAWIKSTSPSTHQIVDGYFLFTNDFAFPNTDGKQVNFDATGNFELETRIKFVSGNVEKYSGLFWGELIFGDKYFFAFSSLGYYKIERETGLEVTEILAPTKSEIVNQTAENTVTVRKYGDKYYFFINKNLVHTMDYEELPGKYIGFTVADNSLVQINFLRLWKIN